MTDLKDIVSKYGVPDPLIVGKLPRGGDKDRARWRRCDVCKQKHATDGFHLDYVGHAEITRILIDIDPYWNWEPVGFMDDGRPKFTVSNGTAIMWARLTLLGKSLLAVGTCPSDKADYAKELIGDFLRNASMRFGIGLSLWTKSEWQEDVEPIEKTDPPISNDDKARFINACANEGLDWETVRDAAGLEEGEWDALRQSGRTKLLKAFEKAKLAVQQPPARETTTVTYPKSGLNPTATGTITELYPASSPIPAKVKAAHPSNVTRLDAATTRQIVALRALLRGGAYTDAEQMEMASDSAGRIIESFEELTKKEASDLIGILKAPKED